MLSRVSTSGLYQALYSNAMRAQVDYSNASTQESSGLAGTSYADYGSSTQRLLNLESEVNNTQTWTDAAKTASSRTQAAYSAIGNMTDILTTLRSTISSAMSATDNSTLNSTAKDLMTELASELNTQSAGRYIFSGGKTDTAAIDTTSYPSTTPVTAGDTSYYKGDSTAAAVTVGQGEKITYGVTGDNSAFEQSMRAIAMVSTLTTSPLDTATLQSAYSLASTAVTSLSNLQEQVSTVSSRLSDKQTQLTATKSALEDTLGDVKNVDTSAAALKVTSYKNQLTASYSALSGIMKVKLTDYL